MVGPIPGREHDASHLQQLEGISWPVGAFPGWGPNLTVTELLEWVNCMFGDVHEYDMMICFLCKIRQKEGESMEEYML